MTSVVAQLASLTSGGAPRFQSVRNSDSVSTTLFDAVLLVVAGRHTALCDTRLPLHRPLSLKQGTRDMPHDNEAELMVAKLHSACIMWAMLSCSTPAVAYPWNLPRKAIQFS